MNRLLSALSLALLSAIGSAQIDLNRNVATVNGDAIKASEWYRRLETLDLKEVYARYKDRMFAFPAGYLALDQMIHERVIFQLAKDKGVFPSDVEVRAELDYWSKNNAELRSNWEKAGRTPQELLYRVRLDLAGFKLQSLGINVTDQEVEKFYKDNPAQFTTPKLYTLRIIVVTDPASKPLVDAELTAGKSFQEVAKELSDDVSRLRGGEYGTVPLSQFPDVFAKAIAATKIGQMSQWVDAGGKSVRFLVEAISPEKLNPLDATLKTQVRRQLMLDRGRVKNNVTKDLNAKLLASKIEILIPEYVEPYRKMLEQIKLGLGG